MAYILNYLLYESTTWLIESWDSVVCITTGYGMDGPGIESQWRRNFPHLSRPVLGTSQHPIQWVLVLSRE